MPTEGREVRGRLTLFGFAPTEARVRLAARSTSWRASRALLALAVAWGLAPLVALLPPHVPWAAAAVVTGLVLAYRRATERVTLLGLSGSCPRCGAPQAVERGRLKQPHPLSCDACRHDLLLRVDALPRPAAGTAP